MKSPEGKTRTSPWDGKDHPEMVGAHNFSCGESIYLSIYCVYIYIYISVYAYSIPIIPTHTHTHNHTDTYRHTHIYIYIVALHVYNRSG